jgi:FHS family Na+ dependent glucose MFS transporter 1
MKLNKYLSMPIRVTIGYYAAFIILGLLTSVMGPAIPDLAEHTHSSLAELSRFLMAGSFGYLLGGFFGGRLYDLFRGHLILSSALFISAVFIALIPLMPLLGLLGVVLFILGFAEGTLDTGGNSLLTWLHGEKVSPFMNGLHFFFGVGAFLAPVVIAQIVAATGTVFASFWIFALAAIPVIFYLSRLPSPVATHHAQDDTHRGMDWFLIGLVAILFFLYVGAEVGFGNWIYTYTVKLGLANEVTANYITSAFWGSFTIGRLVGIPIASQCKPQQIMFVDLLICLGSIGVILLFPDSLAALWIGTLGLGFGMASFFPSAMVMAGRLMYLSGRVTGFFLFGSGGGGMILPFLIGQMIEPIGPQSMMWVILVDLLVNLALLVVLLAYRPKRITKEAL